MTNSKTADLKTQTETRGQREDSKYSDNIRRVKTVKNVTDSCNSECSK